MVLGRQPREASPARPATWTRRLVLAAVVLAFGLWSVSRTFALVAVKADPARAHALAPSDGRVAAAFAASEFVANPDASETSSAARVAKMALGQDATAVAALTVLAFQAQLRGETGLSNRLFAASWKLSRRDQRSQIWAIERAVSRGDITTALHHYDMAMRTSADTQTMLFPALASALSEPLVRAPLLDVLATKPIWRDAFINYLATSGMEPDGTASLFAEGGRGGLVMSSEQRASFAGILFRLGKLNEAWNVYSQLRPGADRTRSRDPNFVAATGTRAIFDWQTGDDRRLSAAFLPTSSGALIDFAVPPGVGGVIIQQRQLLPPGVYQITGTAQHIAQNPDSRPYWSLSCADGRELGRVEVSNASGSEGRFAGRFMVPARCGVQNLAFSVRASDRPEGITGQITSAQLTPLPSMGSQ